MHQWLTDKQPDILALQETKVRDEDFPAACIEDAGYQVVFHGQKSYNGVAVLSRSKPVEVRVGIPGFADEQCRVLLACFDDPSMAVLNLYVPQGSQTGSEKYQYKLRWLDAVLSYVQVLAGRYSQLIVLGDLNIAPADIDVHDPALWDGQVSVSPPERQRFYALQDIGFIDSFRALNPDRVEFSWWDYRRGAYRTNSGLRIDHILATPALNCRECSIDREPRGWPEPTDHAPVSAVFTCG